jgi:hypothetical protein
MVLLEDHFSDKFCAEISTVLLSRFHLKECNSETPVLSKRTMDNVQSVDSYM